MNETITTSSTLSVFLKDEVATERLGALFFEVCQSAMVYLEGDLGAGKTCFCRGLIHKAGFKGTVKSPTYTLLEAYELPTVNIYHFDLYRLQNEEELLFLGCDDYFSGGNLCLVEWSEKACGVLPLADIKIRIERAGQQANAKNHTVTEAAGRLITFVGNSALGQQGIDKLASIISRL